jgi:hypothetical protein
VHGRLRKLLRGLPGVYTNEWLRLVRHVRAQDTANDEIENRIKTITKVFGSASNAMVEAGLTPRPNGRNLATREHVQNDLVEYVFTYGKLPTEKAFSDEMNSVIISEFGSLKEALVAAGFTKVI